MVEYAIHALITFTVAHVFVNAKAGSSPGASALTFIMSC
jgi:hypothetical protein